MKAAIVRAIFGLALGLGLALAKPAATAGPSKPTMPSSPLPMLPSVGKVKIVVHGASLVVVQDVTLPRGDWKGDALDLHVAFGSPGPPRALDAHLVPIEDGALEAEDGAHGEKVTFDRVARRPAGAHPLLGREQMAGVVVHLRASALGSALARGSMAALRLRSVLDLPDADVDGARSVLVRLGASRGTPLTLGRIVIAAEGAKISRAEARLCGPEADPALLALAPRTPSAEERPIAPVLAVRHASDDLCVRVWPR
jgi:hypothetical protein